MEYINETNYKIIDYRALAARYLLVAEKLNEVADILDRSLPFQCSSLRESIASCIRVNGPMTRSEISQALGIHINKITNQLSSFTEFVKVGNLKWGLKDDGPLDQQSESQSCA